MPSRRFSDADLKELLNQGLTNSEAARRLGVTHASVWIRVRKWARPKSPSSRDRTDLDVIARALSAYEARDQSKSPKTGKFTDEALHTLFVKGTNLSHAAKALGVSVTAVRARIRLWEGHVRDRKGPPVKQRFGEADEAYQARLEDVRFRHSQSWRLCAAAPAAKALRAASEKARLATKSGREKANANSLSYYHRQPDKQFARNKARYHSDLNFRLSRVLRARLFAAIGCRGARKSKGTLALVGCSLPELVIHLEKGFRGGMSWENYGAAWVIDHKLPVCAFNLFCPVQQVVCFHFSNLVPLGKVENLEKRKHDLILARQLEVPWYARPS